MITWDLLIPTIPHRHGKLCAFLEELDKQWQPGFGVLVMRDNLQRPWIQSYAKWQDLTELSRADYISFAGDDDHFAPVFVSKVMERLRERPDYVGFPVRITFDGAPTQWKCEHSLRHSGWGTDGDLMYRDIVHQNPIRRELALLSRWETVSADQDEQWAARLRATGKVKTESWIPEEMYYYQPSPDNFHVQRKPLPVSDILPIPQYHWLTVYDDIN